MVPIQYTVVHRGTQGYTGVHRGAVLYCTQGYTGVHKGTLGYTGVQRGTQGYTEIHRGTRGYTGVHRGTQGYIGAHGGMHTQGCSEAHRQNPLYCMFVPPLKSRKTSNERAIARSSRGGEGGVFLTACGEKMRTGTKSWRAKCVARGAMCVALSDGHFQAKISRRENDISKEVYSELQTLNPKP